ncbi:STAS domain-containing protein [Bacillus rubiinfantis]|uniref:STAS domain-containing protein n=1 Tax=Bacillus rubiinfantis TaxID=1499680 RepID=UPI0005A5D8F4|nr:STAS domain-containing protein [Bacillus rubiinfantis]
MRVIEKDQVDIFQVFQELTIKNTRDFREKMNRFLVESRKCLILDLQHVSYINSSALEIIAQAAIEARQNNQELVVAGIKPPIGEIFEIVKFAKVTRLFATLEEAVDYYLQ